MQYFLRLVAATVDPVAPADYIKFLTNELELHRKFLSESIHQLLAFFGIGLTALAGIVTFMGWKSLKDIRDSAKETFERETKKIFDQKAAELEAKYTEISAEHDESKTRIADLDEEYQEKLVTLQEWIARVQTISLTQGEPPTDQQRKARKSPSRILWVDDRLKDNKSLIDEFSHHDITVDTEETVDSAIKRIAHDKYDLIIVDLGHSIEQTGSLQLLKKLRELNNKSEKIVFSARWWVARHGQDAKQLGADLVTANPGIVVEEVMKRLGRS